MYIKYYITVDIQYYEVRLHVCVKTLTFYKISHLGSPRSRHSKHYFFFFFFIITDNFIALIAVNSSLGIQLLPSIPSC
jgi:hypothetical protein